MEKTEREKMIAGELYFSADLDLVRDRKRARTLTDQFNTSPNDPLIRTELLKELFGSTGKALYIEPNFRCDYGYNIHVGENFYANYDCIILDVGEVFIGNNVMFAPRVGIYTAYHPLDAKTRNSGWELGKKVIIGNDVWVGADVTILPGIKIGNGAVIGAGSVVTKDVLDNVVVAGNPAKIIRHIEQ